MSCNPSARDFIRVHFNELGYPIPALLHHHTLGASGFLMSKNGALRVAVILASAYVGYHSLRKLYNRLKPCYAIPVVCPSPIEPLLMTLCGPKCETFSRLHPNQL